MEQQLQLLTYYRPKEFQLSQSNLALSINFTWNLKGSRRIYAKLLDSAGNVYCYLLFGWPCIALGRFLWATVLLVDLGKGSALLLIIFPRVVDSKMSKKLSVISCVTAPLSPGVNGESWPPIYLNPLFDSFNSRVAATIKRELL